MCGRTAQGLAPAQIRQQLDKTLPSKPSDSWIGEEKYRTSYNVAPTRYQPVVRADSKTNNYVVHMMKWGLIPRHIKAMPDYNSVLKSINARDDSLFMGPTGKAMFSHSKNHKRCILLAEGFYEWRRRGKERTPFYTKRRDGGLMLMAAIYDVAQIQGAEEPMYTYATITTNASPQLDWLHDRMPVLIPNHDHEKICMWLDPNLSWNSTLEAMLKPCDEFMEVEETDDSTPGGKSIKKVYALETYQVDEKVNSVRNDSPDFVKPWISSSNKKTLNRFFISKGDSGSSPAAPTSLKADFKPEDHSSTEQVILKNDNTGSIIPKREEAEEIKKEAVDRTQQQVPVSADDAQRDAGFQEQESKSPKREQEDDDDGELRKVLELSRQEDADYEPSATPLETTPSVLSSPRRVSGGSACLRVDSEGSVDLLEKRRKELQQEDEEMKKEHPDETSKSSETEEQEKKEQEELEKAIAASLNGAEGASESIYHSQQSVGSTTPKKDAPPSPTMTPMKRKPMGSSAAASPKKGKSSQDSKITSFFQQANST
ncbi:hypothetical protein BG011_006592 [Mortierella polycephala]|uniref:DUF159-domain-containing protein n=1 Tax=Mortierella polycephala TaxID=41804 RepID=A0A9P6PSC1_9FUNG|nr:hypothetical protein BG011_006592 [Mortierella polycephala]